MKNHFVCFAFLSLIFMVACSSTDQLNNYQTGQENFSTAVSNYEQSKLSKNFDFLATALEKENAVSIEEIKKLKLVQNESKWERVIEELEVMLAREDMLSELGLSKRQMSSLDLFDIESLNDLTSPLAADACAYHYPQGVRMLLEAEKNNDKLLAREAYKHLDIAYKYNANYKNTDQLLNKAYDLACQNVLIILDESVFESIPSEYLFAFEVLDVMEKDWVNFYGVNEQNVNFDLEVKLEIYNFNISESNEVISTSNVGRVIRDYTDYTSTDYARVDTAKIYMQSILNSLGTASTQYSTWKGGVLDGKIIITDIGSNKVLEEKSISLRESIDNSELVFGISSIAENFGIQNAAVDRSINNFPLDKQFAMSLIQQTKSEMADIIDQSL